MWTDLAMLVHQQGEQIDDIAMNVEDTKNYVEKGEKELHTAKDYHKKARKVREIL